MSQPSPLRVLLIVPPTGKFIREDRCQTPIKNLKTVALRPPIDLMYAAAGFRSGGAECRIVDYPGEERTWIDLEADLRQMQPHYLVMSITTPSFEDDMQAASVARRVNPQTITVAKGAHFNTLDLRALREHPELDICLRGEYEETCRDLGSGLPRESVPGLAYRDSTGTPVRTPDRPLTQDLDSLAFPARDLTNNALYIRPDTGEMQTTLVTNRGCPYSCIYCLANQVSGKRNRYRSVTNVLDEISECVERHNIRSFLFRSDLFTQNKDWVRQLCDGIRQRGLKIDWACNSRVDSLDEPTLRAMKDAGCWIVAFGVESGDQAALDRMNKKARVEDVKPAIDLCRKVGVKSSIYLLLGFPWDSRETVRRNMRFAREINPDVLEWFYIYPFPGTTLYRMAVEEGLLEDGTIPRHAYDSPALATKHLSVEELKSLRREAMRDFYLRPGIILRTLASARSPKEMMNYVRYGTLQLWDLLSGNHQES